MTPRKFLFARDWYGTAEPHVVIVRGRAELEARYNTTDADVIEVPYGGESWKRFLHKAGDIVGIGKCSELVLTEVICGNARAKPVIIYIPNAESLAKQCGVELVRFMVFWERFSVETAGGPERILLALQFPRQH